MFGIGYSELETFIRVVHGLDDTGAALGARFRYMQRMGFPQGVNTGKGVRAAYSLSQVLKLMLAFELLETGATPTRAVRVVRTSWPSVASAMVVGWQAAKGELPAGNRLLLAMVPGALRGMGETDDPAAPAPDPLRAFRLSDIRAWGEKRLSADQVGSVERYRPATLLIDPMQIATAVRDLLPPNSSMVREDIDAAYRAFEREISGKTPEAE